MSKAKDTASFGNDGFNAKAAVAAGAPNEANLANGTGAVAGAGAAAGANNVRINGFQQVLEMLRIADPAFRESLLKRLAMKDRELASQLRHDLAVENN